MRIVFLSLTLLVFSGVVSQSTSSLSGFLNKIDGVRNDTSALRSLDSLCRYKNYNSKERLEINIRRVIRYFILQEFNNAIRTGTEGLATSHREKLDSLESGFNEQVGNTYYYMSNRPKALEYYKAGIAIAEKNSHWEVAAACYNNMGSVLIELEQYPDAENALTKSIAIMNSLGKKDINSNISIRLLATLYSLTGREEKAEALYFNAIKTARDSQDTTTLCNNLIYYSTILSEKGDSTLAIKFSEEALGYLKIRNKISDYILGLSKHSKILARTGRHQEAFNTIVEVNRLLKISFNKDLNEKIAEMEVKYKTDLIKQQKEEAEENTIKQRWIFLLSFLSIFLIAGGLILFLIQKKAAKHKTLLNRQRIEALIEGEEKERRRIARDLHDGIVQELTAIKLKLGMQNVDPLIISDIDKATKEVRDIAYQMMPVTLKEYGLIPAFEELLKKSHSAADIEYDFETANLNERLPEKIEVCLYRITQELINNVIKHSKASKISLTISKYQTSVTLILEDNGSGFRNNEIKKGIGMAGFSSRLDVVNGNIKFESTAGFGTTAIIKIPVL